MAALRRSHGSRYLLPCVIMLIALMLLLTSVGVNALAVEPDEELLAAPADPAEETALSTDTTEAEDTAASDPVASGLSGTLRLLTRVSAPSTEPTDVAVAEIAFRDADGTLIPLSDTNSDTYDFAADTTATASNPSSQRAESIEVAVTASELDLAVSKVVLVDENGATIAEASFGQAYEEDGATPIAWTYVAKLEHPTGDDTKPLPEQAVGIKVIAADTDGNRLEVTDDADKLSDSDRFYALYGAKVKAFDEGGSSVKKIYADGSLMLDRTAPVLSGMTVKQGSTMWVIGNDTSGVNGTVTITCNPQELALDATKSKVVLVDRLDESHPEYTADLSWDSLTHRLSFEPPDGQWDIKYQLVDAAGNVGEAGTYTNVTLDGEAPQISFAFKGATVDDPGTMHYYQEGGTVTVTVIEGTLNKEKSLVEIYVGDEATLVDEHPASGWTRSGNIYTASLDITDEGFYRIHAKAEDVLGNAVSKEYDLVIDKNPPIIEAQYVDGTDTAIEATTPDDAPLAADYLSQMAKVTFTISDSAISLAKSTIAVKGSDTASTKMLFTVVEAGSTGVTVDGITIKCVGDTTTDGVRTLVIDVIYPDDGVYDMPVVDAQDNVYDPVTSKPGTPDLLVIDTKAPVLTARISQDPADASVMGTTAAGAPITNGALNGTGGLQNYVWFYKSGETAKIELTAQESFGIKTIELADASGRYTLDGAFESTRQAGNAKLTGAGTTSSFDDFLLADPLADGVDFSDNVMVKVTDFVGYSTVWSLANGLETPSEGTVYPTLLVEDDTAPTLIVTKDIESKATADAADENPSYVRYFNEAQELGLTLSDLTIKYLRGFTGATEGDQYEDINGYYTGIDEERPVVSIVKDGDAANAQALTVSDFTSSDNGKDYNLTHSFAEDGEYELTLEVEDVTRNAASATVETFVIDRTAPTIEVTYDNNDAHNGSYYNAARTATVTVVEHNFDPNLFEVKTTFTDHAKGAAEPTISWDSSTTDTHTCTVSFTEDGHYELIVEGIDKAGNAAVLKSDATVTTFDDVFTIDTENPIIAPYFDFGTAPASVFDADDPAVEFPEPSGTYDGTNYYAHAITLFAKVKDRTIDTANLANSLKLKVEKDGSEADPGVTWGRVPDERGENGYELYQATVPYDEDGEYKTPHVVATDLADNSTDNASDTKPFVVDLEPPTVKVDVDKTPASQGMDGGDPVNFYNQTTTMTFTVSDKHKLRSAEVNDPDNAYTVKASDTSAEGKDSVVFTVQLKDGTTSSDNEYQRDIVLTAIDLAGNERTWTIDHTGKIVKDEQVDGAWKQVASEAGNEGINGGTEHPVSLIQDTVAPVVGLSGVTAGTYYNTAQNVVATVNELNLPWLQRFDPSRTVVTVTKYEGAAGRAKSSWTIPASSFTGSKPNYAFSQAFNSDGHYVVEAQFADFATNLSNKATIGEFTIDMTPPTLTMEFDNNDVRNEKYYKATRTATITVVEHNFDPSLFKIETEGSIGSWSTNGDTHTITVFFGEGGPYTIKVSGKDLANNEAPEVSEPEFIVDLTAPEVKIAGTAQRLGNIGEAVGAGGNGLVRAYHGDLEDKNAYNGVVVPVITYTDNEELATDDLSFALAGSKHGEGVEIDATTSEPGKEMTTTLADIGYQGEGAADGSNWQSFYVDDYAPDGDDIYTLTAKLTDQAGNEAEGELTFSVNRYGSNYDVRLQGLEQDEIDEFKKSGMLSASPTIVVREVNVSGVEDASDHHVEKEFANATTAIRRSDNEAGGYSLKTVDPKKATNGWSEYVYTVRNSNFGEGSDSDQGDGGQGVYRVNVTSDDTSSNANTTADFWKSDKARTKVTATGATAEFVLDQMGPAIDDLDLPEHLSRGDVYEASFHVTDDITSGNTIEVTVDGQTLGAAQVKGPGNGVGTYTFEIAGKPFNWGRSVKIVVRDYAGREVSASNPTWIWQSSFIPEGLVVLGVLAAIAAVIAAWVRRKRAAEPELPEW